MSNNDKEKWIMLEYELLSNHYFHEDNYYLKTNVLFLSLNAAMLAFIGGKYDFSLSQADKVILGIYFPLVGIIASLAWIISLHRTYTFRMRIESRIKEIEDSFEDMLKIRSKWKPLPLLATIPSTVAMRVFPAVVFFMWIIILVKFLSQ